MSPPASTSFSFEPLFLVLAAAAVYGYVRLARTVERPSGWRVTLFGLGVAFVAVSLNSPLETIAVHYLLLVHLLQNVMVADWAPPLLVLGLTPAMRAAVARRGGRTLAALTRPRFVLPCWLTVWYGVHLPLFYDYALRHPWLLNLEHALLLGARAALLVAGLLRAATAPLVGGQARLPRRGLCGLRVPRRSR